MGWEDSKKEHAPEKKDVSLSKCCDWKHTI